MDRLDARTTGYWGLLNFEVDRHQTVFVSDFELDAIIVARLSDHLQGAPTRMHVHRLDGDPNVLRTRLTQGGIDLARDYLSVHALTVTYEAHDAAYAFFDGLQHGDFTRVELPSREMGAAPAQVNALIDVVMGADYAEQDRIAGLFFDLLELTSPYEVIVQTPGARLTIRDTRPWFQLAGRLQPGEQRILPGGEVAYTGTAIDGTIAIDGAILAVPQRPEVAPIALHLGSQSAQLARNPIMLRMSAGQVTAVGGTEGPAQALAELLQNEAYRSVTEVGLSFNRACGSYIHDWPAASNEGRPGAHIALGGVPDPKGARPPADGPMVHIDLMAANTEVTVNGRLFLQTSW